jgi:hypothetical protein
MNILNNSLSQFQKLKIPFSEARGESYGWVPSQIVVEATKTFQEELSKLRKDFKYFSSVENEDLIEVTRKFINRDQPTEITTTVLNGKASQIQEILFKYFNDRNKTINDILLLGRRTWNTIDQLF